MKERYINLNDEGARKLFAIPTEIPDPNSAAENHSDIDDNLSEVVDGEYDSTTDVTQNVSTNPSPVPKTLEDAGDASRQDQDLSEIEGEVENDIADNDGKPKIAKPKTPVIKMLPVSIPEIIIGDTLILLLECTKVKSIETNSTRNSEGNNQESSDEKDADYYMLEKAGPEDYEVANEECPKS